MRSPVAIAIILGAFQILSCHGSTPNSRLNFFDIDLLRYAAEDKKGNVMVSPASIKSTLAMLLEGADGPTANEIKTALRVSPVEDDYRQELNVFLKALEANTTNVTLQNANAMFVSKKLKLRKEYETTVQRLYFSETKQLDFNDPKSSANSINSWAKAKTQGLIPTVVDEAEITPSTQMLITNALYFKASWKYSFDVKSTHSDCFYNNGICKNVAMMDLQAELKYTFVKDLRAHALELPYQGGRYSMLLLVPQNRDSGLALVRDLPYIGLPHIWDQLEPNDVMLTLPKFNIEYNENMVEALKRMRITSLFSDSASLSGIFEGEDSPHLNSIYHSVRMKVDEVGTVAAAATVSLVVPLINNQVQLRVDRPFLFFIRDNELGLVLFEGKIEEPTEFVEDKVLALTAEVDDEPPVLSHIIPIQQLYDYHGIKTNKYPFQTPPQEYATPSTITATKPASTTTQNKQSIKKIENISTWIKKICSYIYGTPETTKYI